MTKKLKELEVYASILKGLQERWRPHTGQIQVGKALLQDGCRDIFVQAGRNWGKTNLVCYLLWRWAMMNPGSQNYYFAPYMKQAREIVWAPRILQNFGPREWTAEHNDSQMRIPFRNGSFIKADGSDNVNAYRGIKPKGLIIFDEFKDFREEFFEAFDPNRAAHNAPLIIIGTPPGRESQFTRVRDAYKNDESKRYFHGPTAQNPHISKDWLHKKQEELEARGEADVWQREYEAIDTPHAQTKLFPMIDKTRHVVAHDEILRRIKKDRKRLDWILWTDPAAASTFAVLFAVHNPYTKEVFLLDEIYETEQSNLTVNQIGPRITQMRDSIEDNYEWRQGYDEAATWFANEMLDNFSEHFEPSSKSANSKDVGLSLIKDMLLQNKLIISDRCVKTFWEMDNYYKDGSGKIPKVFDHLIDSLRYILAALFYSLPEQDQPKDPIHTKPTKLTDDFPQLKGFIR